MDSTPWDPPAIIPTIHLTTNILDRDEVVLDVVTKNTVLPMLVVVVAVARYEQPPPTIPISVGVFVILLLIT